MATEITLKFLAAGTYGNDYTDEGVFFYPVNCHSIIFNINLFQNELTKKAFEAFPGIYTLKGNFPESGLIAIPLNQLALLVETLGDFVTKNSSSFFLRPHKLTAFFQALVSHGYLTQTLAATYFKVLPTTNTLEDKIIKAEVEKDANLAIEIAGLEKESRNEKSCLIWLMKAKNYQPKHDFFHSDLGFKDIISSICLTEFKQLFDDGNMPFWLLNAKANADKHKRQVNFLITGNAFNKVFDSSQTGLSLLERINGLKQAKLLEPNHPIFATPLCLVEYLADMDENSFRLLLLEGEVSYWLLDALSFSSTKTTVTLDENVFRSETAQNSIYRFLSQARHLIVLNITVAKSLKLDAIDKRLTIINKALECIGSIDTLNLSNFPMGNKGLVSIIDTLQNSSLHNFTTLDLQNCTLNDMTFDLLKSFITKCDSIKEIRLAGNVLLEKRQGEIDHLIHLNSPIELMRRHFSSTDLPVVASAASHSSDLEEFPLVDIHLDECVSMTELMKEGGTADLTLEEKRELICDAVNKALETLWSPIKVFKSRKHAPLYKLKDNFDSCPNMLNFKTLLAEIMDSKWFSAQGLTGSFKLFLNHINEKEITGSKLLPLIHTLLKDLQDEMKTDFSKAIEKVEKSFTEPSNVSISVDVP